MRARSGRRPVTHTMCFFVQMIDGVVDVRDDADVSETDYQVSVVGWGVLSVIVPVFISVDLGIVNNSFLASDFGGTCE